MSIVPVGSTQRWSSSSAPAPLLQSINAVYNPSTIHEPTDAEYKEFKTGRCRPWAEDRVM
jgi:hypothetical protein